MHMSANKQKFWKPAEEYTETQNSPWFLYSSAVCSKMKSCDVEQKTTGYRI